MGNIVSFLITVLDKYTIWFYLVFMLISLVHLRSFVMSRRNRSKSPYTIEREVAAHKEGRALSGIGVMLGLAAVVAAVKMFILPGIDISKLNEPTPTLTLPPATKVFATLTPGLSATPTEGGEATPAEGKETSPAATRPPSDTAVPEEEPTAAPAPTAAPPPPPACPSEGVQIASPGSGAVLSGQVAIVGTANIGQFQFYKIEYSPEQPGNWRVIGDLHYQAVDGGVLESLNTAALPNGTYYLQLTAVDQSGNFPAPCQVRVIVQN